VVGISCVFTLDEASTLGTVPVVTGFSASVTNLVSGSFPAPVLGPFMLCNLTCFNSPGISPVPCTGMVTVKDLLSK
jgi:hypothetical protein